MFTTLMLILLLQQWSGCHGAKDADLVTSLPGLPQMPAYKQYSGYLKATGGRMLHYWFIESQGSPSEDPVVVWLNGGPGCSSMDGLLQENGPFLVQSDGLTLKENHFAWNKIANMLYLEAPAGVGYSYKDDKNYTTSDDQVAMDNHAALTYFLIHFNEFSQNDFYVTGESYGGIYVPTLSTLLVDDSAFNFKGFAVGNGLSDIAMNGNSLIFFGYHHGLWGVKLYGELIEFCCKDGNNRHCDFVNSQDPDCQNAVNAAVSIISTMNVYNLYAPCYHSNSGRITHPALQPLMHLFRANVHMRTEYKILQFKSKDQLEASPPCINATAITAYLNRGDVRVALHIKDDLPAWQICSGDVGARYVSQYTSMKGQYLRVLTKGKRILVYNGDVDMACNFLGDEWFVDSLQQEIEKDYSAWFYNGTDGFHQVAGFAKQFQNISFVTIKGAGHMVPQDKPHQAYIMFRKYLKQERF